MSFDQNTPEPMSAEEAQGRKSRNLVIALALVGFMVLIFAITMLRLKEGVQRDQDWVAETAQGQSAEAVVKSGSGEPPKNVEPEE